MKSPLHSCHSRIEWSEPKVVPPAEVGGTNSLEAQSPARGAEEAEGKWMMVNGRAALECAGKFAA